MELNLGFVAFAALMVFLLVVRPLWGLLRDRRRHLDAGSAAERAEALFRASFPELQPHFHPASVADYVVARVEEGLAPVQGVIEKPPGFAAAARARVTTAPKGERTILEDEGGSRIAEFVLEPKEGALGAVRVGPGRFTVRRKPGMAATVKYWHPEREFSWSPPSQWRFDTRLADTSIDASERGTSWSDSSPSSTGRAAAAAAGLVGAGGTFDGGGASAAWTAQEANAASESVSGTATGSASVISPDTSPEASPDASPDTSPDTSSDTSTSTDY